MLLLIISICFINCSKDSEKSEEEEVRNEKILSALKEVGPTIDITLLNVTEFNLNFEDSNLYPLYDEYIDDNGNTISTFSKDMYTNHYYYIRYKCKFEDGKYSEYEAFINERFVLIYYMNARYNI